MGDGKYYGKCRDGEKAVSSFVKILFVQQIVKGVTSNKETVIFNQKSLLLSFHGRGNCV
jgi:hypothetical protein